MSEDKPSGLDILKSKAIVPNVSNREVPTLQELRDIRAKYEATITQQAAPPIIKDFLKELGLEKYTTYVVKTAKTENWEYRWNRNRVQFTREIEKQEQTFIENAAFDYTQKFSQYMLDMVNTIDQDLPAVMKELHDRMSYMGDKELLGYATMLIKMRDGILDKISEAKHKAPTLDTDTKNTERELLSGLGLLSDLIQLANKSKEELSKEEATEAEFREVDTDVKATVFSNLDEK